MACSLVLGLAQCGNTNNNKVTQQEAECPDTLKKIVAFTVDAAVKFIEDKTWKLVSIDKVTNDAFATDADAFTLDFLEDNKLAGTGACNRFNGSYTINSKDDLTINMGGSTRMACPNMNLEQEYFNALSKVTKYSVSLETLTLFNGEEEVAQFKVK